LSYFESIILGIIQGLTEFLPVSSSGHLVISARLFGIVNDNITFEIFVHFGTLLSVIVIYFQDLKKMVISFFSGIFSKKAVEYYKNDVYFRLSTLVIVGTIPAVFAGLFLKDLFENVFHNISLVGVSLLITSVILFATKFIKVSENKNNMNKSLLIGVAQMFAIFPGISRAGMTISSGLFLGLSRYESARFSFLLAIPAILGATVLELGDVIKSGLEMDLFIIYILGMITSFIVGYFAIRILLKVLQSGKFSWFAPYCFLVGIGTLIFLR